MIIRLLPLAGEGARRADEGVPLLWTRNNTARMRGPCQIFENVREAYSSSCPTSGVARLIETRRFSCSGSAVGIFR